jgi:hypothetical protein
MAIRKLNEIKFALLTLFVAIFFITYMAYDFHTSYSIDDVGGWERIFILVNFIFHMPFLAFTLMAVTMFFKKTNKKASLVLGSVSLLYIILHLVVPFFLLGVKFSLYFITIFPLLGLVISIISYIECLILNEKEFIKLY